MFLFEGRHVLRGDLQDQIEDSHAAASITADFPQGGSQGGSSLIKILEHRLWKKNRLTPHSPGLSPVGGRCTELEEECGLLMYLTGRYVTKLRHLDPRPIGLSGVHAIITSKGELPYRKDGDPLELFIGRRKDACFQERITGLLDHIGQRHKRISIF